jgi:uracil-DNA glycosylase family protein
VQKSPIDEGGSAKKRSQTANRKSKKLDSRQGQEEHALSAAAFLPAELTLNELQVAAKGCRGCDLYKHATQTVFGQGPKTASIMLIGEQPGDSEDKEGWPFVGPAGKLLRKCLQLAEIDESEVYLTNAVKHFKYEWRGKRRLHSKPRKIEVEACLPWLDAEIATVKPDIIVCLGATASQALLGSKFRLTQHRLEPMPSDLARIVVATVHPSSILRARDSQARHQQMDEFVADLVAVKKMADEMH